MQVAWVLLVLDGGEPRGEAFDREELADAAASTVQLTVSPKAWVAVLNEATGLARVVQRGEFRPFGF